MRNNSSGSFLHLARPLTVNSEGQIEKTSDRDYEVEERRFRTMESAATKLQKEAKGYLDALRGMFFLFFTELKL